MKRVREARAAASNGSATLPQPLRNAARTRLVSRGSPVTRTSRACHADTTRLSRVKRYPPVTATPCNARNGNATQRNARGAARAHATNLVARYNQFGCTA